MDQLKNLSNIELLDVLRQELQRRGVVFVSYLWPDPAGEMSADGKALSLAVFPYAVEIEPTTLALFLMRRAFIDLKKIVLENPEGVDTLRYDFTLHKPEAGGEAPDGPGTHEA